MSTKYAGSLILSTLLGGLVALVWTTISWNLLQWHDATLSTFDDDVDVVTAITRNAHADGIYVLPSGNGSSEAEVKALAKGPTVFAAVRLGGFGSFPNAILAQLASLLFAALLTSFLLSQLRPMSYVKRVGVVACVGLIAGVVSEIPYWNWWGFPLAHTALNLADTTITWLLAGLVMARIMRSDSVDVDPSR